jgi:hypothetical protein
VPGCTTDHTGKSAVGDTFLSSRRQIIVMKKQFSKAANENLVLGAPRAYLNYLKSMKKRGVPSAEKQAASYALAAIKRSGIDKKKAIALLTDIEKACGKIRTEIQKTRP